MDLGKYIHFAILQFMVCYGFAHARTPRVLHFSAFIATSIVCVLYCTNFTFCGAFVSKVVPGATIYKITRFYLNRIHQFPHLVLLLLARYSYLLPEAILLLYYKIYIVYRDLSQH